MTTVDAMDAFMVPQENSTVALDTGATGKPVCVSRMARCNRVSERHGIPRVTTYPSQARIRFGDGRLGEVRRFADMPAWIAGNEGAFTACVIA